MSGIDGQAGGGDEVEVVPTIHVSADKGTVRIEGGKQNGVEMSIDQAKREGHLSRGYGAVAATAIFEEVSHLVGSSERRGVVSEDSLVPPSLSSEVDLLLKEAEVAGRTFVEGTCSDPD